MPRSLRSIENYLLIDNRASGEGMREIPMATCCHCNRQVALNPMRTRDRNFCRKCMQYVCDEAACVLNCNGGLDAVFDALDKAERKFIF